MEKLARGLMWIDDIVLKLNLFVCSCLLLEAVIVAGLGVIFRFVLHDSLSWSDEVSAYLFVWLTCLDAAAGVKLRAHPEVRVLADRVPPWSRPCSRTSRTARSSRSARCSCCTAPTCSN
ncbi:TRAP transporter small permease subunit [Caballeronia sp. LZ033]|nr:TRAP transporter small permease subunit [Caballeronia sp. LZ033]MDR5815023.1 TRAP transporter small permease subunit [Caballeronia sp. LZ033]